MTPALATHAITSGITLRVLERELQRVGARVLGDAGSRIVDVRQDSRLVRKGDLFAARGGKMNDGVAYVSAALERGAVAVMIERGSELPNLAVPVIEVDDVRLAIALAAEAVHAHPSRAISLVGITGTNGKTTTTFLVQHAIAGAGARAARLGTLGFDFGVDRVDSPLTTPEADEISRYAARVRDGGGSHLVMEVSSHALAQARVDAVEFSVAAFTNLTQDHLDYHGTIDEYGAAKLRLFTDLRPKASVVNIDDPFGRHIAERAGGTILRVGRGADADVRPLETTVDARGIAGTIAVPSGVVEIASRLVGEHNLDNVLLTLGIVEVLGLDVSKAARELGAAPQVPGRLERCDVVDDDVTVLVDYAHTPDALSRALAAVRSLTTGAVICVFGCGGDRDPNKRSKMGQAVGRLADRAIVTNDNPRSEAPEAIAQAIEAGLRATRTPYEVVLDRSRAIELAIERAAPGDVVLIAGKGHEPYQIVGAERRPFDDRLEARRALSLRRARQ